MKVFHEKNFGPKWVSWIKSIFESSSISVLVNGSPSGEFKPTRGLRQGDLLSSLLFNIVGEGLSRMLQIGSEQKKFIGVSFPNNEGVITHL